MLKKFKDSKRNSSWMPLCDRELTEYREIHIDQAWRFEDIPAQVSKCGRRRRREIRDIKPMRAGPHLARDADLAVDVGPIHIAGRIQGSGVVSEEQRRTPLRGEHAVELPSAQEPFRRAAPEPPAVLPERQRGDVTLYENGDGSLALT